VNSRPTVESDTVPAAAVASRGAAMTVNAGVRTCAATGAAVAATASASAVSLPLNVICVVPSPKGRVVPGAAPMQGHCRRGYGFRIILRVCYPAA